MRARPPTPDIKQHSLNSRMAVHLLKQPRQKLCWQGDCEWERGGGVVRW